MRMRCGILDSGIFFRRPEQTDDNTAESRKHRAVARLVESCMNRESPESGVLSQPTNQPRTSNIEAVHCRVYHSRKRIRPKNSVSASGGHGMLIEIASFPI